MERKNEVSLYLQNISLVLLGILFLALPLIFTTITTDAFIIPKQILLAAITGVSLFLFGAKMISDRKVILRRTPFDLPLILLVIFVFLSSLFALNRYDSLIAFVPFLLSILAYFVIVNLIKNESSILFLLSSLVVGGFLLSILTILSFFKVYILPFKFTQIQNFTPLGSLLDQALYLGAVLALTVFFVLRLAKTKNFQKVEKEEIAFGVGFVGILAGFILTVYQLVTLPSLNGGLLVLPFETGYQTAFAAISQDTGRITQGLLFGSGFGTYAVDFSKYKLPTFNLNQTLWSLTFFRSSSFVLEFLATAGILGIFSFFFLIWKTIKTNQWREKIQNNPVFIPLVLLFVTAFLLPFSSVIQTLLFLLLALFAAIQGINPNLQKEKSHNFFDIEFHFLAAKNSIIPFSTSPVVGEEHKAAVKEELPLTKFLPVSFFIVFTLFTGIIGYFVVRFVNSDITFQNSLVAASANNGLETYNNQVNAISMFPYRDVYYRVYSQTNLALANSLASSAKDGVNQNAQTQQTIYNLIQQAINAARQATAISPQSSINWQNLSSVYRSLIGFGQNAENFALVSAQQAVLLDPNNPQQYVNLGGIYYQLGQWDNAQRQFQVAINLKPDFANAYYNLGHALESKGDLQNALNQYNAVKTLIADNSDATKKITEEINSLQAKIGDAALNSTPVQNEESDNKNGLTNSKAEKSSNQQPLKLSSPSEQLPEQNPQVKIPPPTEASGSGR